MIELSTTPKYISLSQNITSDISTFRYQYPSIVKYTFGKYAVFRLI